MAIEVPLQERSRKCANSGSDLSHPDLGNTSVWMLVIFFSLANPLDAAPSSWAGNNGPFTAFLTRCDCKWQESSATVFFEEKSAFLHVESVDMTRDLEICQFFAHFVITANTLSEEYMFSRIVRGLRRVKARIHPYPACFVFWMAEQQKVMPWVNFGQGGPFFPPCQVWTTCELRNWQLLALRMREWHVWWQVWTCATMPGANDSGNDQWDRNDGPHWPHALLSAFFQLLGSRCLSCPFWWPPWTKATAFRRQAISGKDLRHGWHGRLRWLWGMAWVPPYRGIARYRNMWGSGLHPEEWASTDQVFGCPGRLCPHFRHHFCFGPASLWRICPKWIARFSFWVWPMWTLGCSWYRFNIFVPQNAPAQDGDNPHDKPASESNMASL